MKKRAQTLSLDLIIAIVVFIAIITLFVSVIMPNDSSDRLRNDADLIFAAFDTTSNPAGRGIIDGNVVKTAALEDLIDEDYSELKNELGITGEFCIIVVDDSGSLRALGNDSSGNPQYTFGPGTDDVRPADGIGC